MSCDHIFSSDIKNTKKQTLFYWTSVHRLIFYICYIWPRASNTEVHAIVQPWKFKAGCCWILLGLPFNFHIWMENSTFFFLLWCDQSWIIIMNNYCSGHRSHAAWLSIRSVGTSACVLALKNLMPPLLVIFKQVESSWKQRLSSHLSIGTHTARAHESRLGESVHVPAVPSSPRLCSAHGPKLRRIVLWVTRCVTPFHQPPPPPPRLDVVSWASALSASLGEDSSRSTAGSAGSYRCRDRASVLDHLSERITLQFSGLNSHEANFSHWTGECTHTVQCVSYPMQLSISTPCY